MWKIYQNKTVTNDGHGNCLNACVASILELKLNEASNILPNTGGDWHQAWNDFLAEKGYRFATFFSVDDDDDSPPKGYSIATVYTDRIYPDTHPKAGKQIAHAVVMFDGVLVHDPYPLGSTITQILYYKTLVPLTEAQKTLKRVEQFHLQNRID